jgi:hypothetical protein
MSTPRQYLSWSQLQLWEKDPQQYFLVYFEGVNKYRSKYIELGKRLAKCLELGKDELGDQLIEKVAKLIPNYPNKEFEIRETFEGISLLSFLDGWDEDNFIIHEVKSGTHWCQKDVDNCSQLSFYALQIWLKYKKLPKSIELHWAKTEVLPDGSLVLTGEVKNFKTTRTLKDIIIIGGRIKKAWKGIQTLGEFIKGGSHDEVCNH